ncbi:hypothetical protein ACJQWK_07000 [Exserohilum turcicum]
MLWKQLFFLAAVMASPAFSAPAPQSKVPSSQQLTCTPNNQGVDVCCDQFGGCIFRKDLGPEFADRIVNKRAPEPKNLNCTPNNQGAIVCCDEFGGCAFKEGKSSCASLSFDKF